MLVKRPGSVTSWTTCLQQTMSTESLRTQLDNVQTELYQVAADNRKLRDAEPDRAQLLDVEGELAQTREENVRLAQQISKLSRNREDQEARLVEQQSLKETIARLENEAEERDHQLEAYKARLQAAQGDVETLTARVRGGTEY